LAILLCKHIHFSLLVLLLLHLFRSLIIFIDPATTEIYTLSLHDALPILDSTASRAMRSSVAQSPPLTPTPPMHSPSTMTGHPPSDRKSTRLNSSHVKISYAVFCLKKKKKKT